MSSDTPSEPGSRRTAILTAIVGFAVLAAVTFTGSRAPRDFRPGSAVLLGTVDRATADPRVEAALVGALDVALSQSRVIQAVEGRPGRSRFRLDVAVQSVEAPYRLLGAIHDSLGGAVDSVTAEGVSWIEAADRLALEVRAWFGERRTERDRADVPVARLGSPSFDALAAYGEGLRFRAAGADSSAMEAARTAVAADSGFAQAWELAGLAALALKRSEGEAWAARGRELLNRGPRRPGGS